MGGGSAGEKMAGIASRRLFIHRLTFWTDRLGFLSAVRDKMRMSEIDITQVKLNRLCPFFMGGLAGFLYKIECFRC